ncbi:hypothetical protein OHB49_40735 [Streptomyces sp. NBC_01717]|uniref:hypothetical protein n=1 Tax=Streptomyces sp. NBC_01717 TaxID=2975918 RepID=UPI002E368C9F|nr:hypothetical protein [Streptomyces sp. NBC_01717]
MADRSPGGTSPATTVRHGTPFRRDAGATHVGPCDKEEAVTPAVSKLTDFLGKHL